MTKRSLRLSDEEPVFSDYEDWQEAMASVTAAKDEEAKLKLAAQEGLRTTAADSDSSPERGEGRAHSSVVSTIGQQLGSRMLCRGKCRGRC